MGQRNNNNKIHVKISYIECISEKIAILHNQFVLTGTFCAQNVSILLFTTDHRQPSYY